MVIRVTVSTMKRDRAGSLYEAAWTTTVVERARLRFLAKVGPPNERGCREWMGKRDRNGYGTVCILPLGTELKAHRVAWALANGPIPLERPVIRHTCDNASCCEPTHLEPGTQAENVADAVGRARNSAGRGERHRKAKLTEAQVAEIRSPSNAASSGAELARRFGVGRDEISRIRTGKIWNPLRRGN